MTSTLVDSHAHLDLFKDDLDDVLRRAYQAGVGTILAIGIGDGPQTMHRARDLAKQSNARVAADQARIVASSGIYPGDADAADAAALHLLAELLADPLVVACGEIGLDYYHVESPEPPIQKDAMIAQMRLAAEVRKPIILHCRTAELATPAAKAKFDAADAWEDLLTLLAEHWAPTGLPGIMHCFSGTPQHVRRSLDLGFYLSFAGNLTYPAAKLIREAARLAPADRILVETDSPFLAPIPHRGQRNEPALLRHTAETLATLRGISLDELADDTTRNFRTLFPSTAGTPQERQG